MPQFLPKPARIRPTSAPLPSAAFLVCASLGLSFSLAAAAVDVSKLPPPAASADFVKDIKPLLETACVQCHNPKKHKGSFRADTREMFMKGGKEAKAVIEGDSAKSPVVHYVARLVEDLEMPPKKSESFSPQQIGLFRKWIDDGAKWPDGVTLVTAKSKTETKASAVGNAPDAGKDGDDDDEDQSGGQTEVGKGSGKGKDSPVNVAKTVVAARDSAASKPAEAGSVGDDDDDDDDDSSGPKKTDAARGPSLSK